MDRNHFEQRETFKTWQGEILKNKKQLLVHSRIVNNIARIKAALHKSKKRHTVETQRLQNLMECMDEWDPNPFYLPQLRTLQSGVPASYKLCHDLNRCNKSNTFLGKCMNEENE